jgi:predicted acylesterase/phospholipase RssA
MPFLVENSNIKAIPISFLLLLGYCLSGCSSITGLTIDTMRNEPLSISTEVLEPTKNNPNSTNNVFIGIAMSGGGSRATNFSAAVLLELEKLGILQHATAISSVSGSSLAAAYYGLYGDNADLSSDHPWKEDSIREAFLTDFLSSWFQSWFNPWNVVRYWFTNFTRSDIMIETLNDELYDGKLYKDFIKHDDFPQILINATSFTNGQPFIFTEKHFAKRLNSNLDTYPVANAVMASSAFPGVFHSVTLKDYSVKNNELVNNNNESQNYEHLIDGGPSDNLGVTSLINILDPEKYKHCLFLVIDAYPYHESAENIQKPSTRKWHDFIFDSGSVLASTDIMLAQNRKLILEKVLGPDTSDVGFQSFNKKSTIRVSPANSKKNDPEITKQCAVWHLSFQRLYSHDFESVFARQDVSQLQFLERVRKVVNSVPTNYRLEESQEGYEPKTVQDYIFKAANILVRKDKTCNDRSNQCNNNQLIYKEVCNLLVNQWNLKDIKSRCN